MSSLVIAAIPREDDRVWKISSEKKPHMTILFLGDADNPNRNLIAGFLAHCINLPVITRFDMEVERRGELGEDKADVLIFDKTSWSFPKVENFRNLLLQDPHIKTAYDSVEQFSEWTPHLTLGYPDTPAKKMDDMESRLYYVDFDRVALWEGDYEGAEFILKREVYMDIAMSDEARNGRDFLEHFGVKGMRWGVRNERPGSPVTTESRTRAGLRGNKTKVKAKGGEGQDAHSDAVKVAGKKQILKKSGPKALSDQDLQDIIRRTQLESQAQAAVAGKGAAWIKRQGSSTRDQQTQQFINELVTPQRRKLTAS